MAVGARSLLVTCAPTDPRWLQLLRSHFEATAFHLPEWSEAVSSTYGYTAVVLVMEDDRGRVIGGLPVVECHRPLGGKRLVSLPFTDHCPPLVMPGAEAEFTAALGEWREDKGGAALEVRARLPGIEGAQHHVVGTRHLLALEADPETIFKRFDRSRIQKRIRTARAAGVETVITRSRADMTVFYRLHCATRKRLGVPVQPLRFIENVWSKLVEPGLGFLVLAHLGGRPIGAALFLAYNRRLLYKYSASVSTAWNLRPNLMILWAAMEWGCANGYTILDMGRTDSDNESLRVFKAGWGSEEMPLVYTRFGPAGDRFGHGPVARVLSNVIRRSPTVVCRVLGETLYRFAA
jgi:CelD/BcsL family acetyltransferase involved in cellulose biosynthesis